MNKADIMNDEVYRILVENEVAQSFADAMRKRAELLVRAIPVTVQENRALLEGQIIFCYELADGAEFALKLAAAKAKAVAEGRNPDDVTLSNLVGMQAESLG